MKRNANSRLVLVAMMGIWSLLGVGCTTFTQEAKFAASYPAHAQKVTARPVVLLHVEDAIADTVFKQDATFLGEDVYERWFMYGLFPMGKDYRYVADLPRIDLVKSVLDEKLGSAGLPLTDQSRANSLQVSAGTVYLSARISRLAATTSFSSFLPLVVYFIFNYHNEQVDAVLDIQVTQAGNSNLLWQGTVSGKVTDEEFKKMEGTAGANAKGQYAWMVHEAIDRSVQSFMQQSQIVEVSARLRNDAYANVLKPAQEGEAKGDLQTALTHYGRAYAAADTEKRSLEVITAVAKVLKKLNGQVVFPEEARKFGVQATSLVEKKRYDEATTLYQKALEIAPWWAEGHFNLALVLAEQNRFHEAIAGMKHFVILAPDSADARAAQDMLYEWELEAPRVETGSSLQRSQIPAEAEKAMKQTGNVVKSMAESTGQSRSAFGAMMGTVKK